MLKFLGFVKKLIEFVFNIEDSTDARVKYLEILSSQGKLSSRRTALNLLPWELFLFRKYAVFPTDTESKHARVLLSG